MKNERSEFAIQQAKREKVVSIGDIEGLLRWRQDDASVELMCRLRSLECKGLFSSKIGQRVIDMAEKYGSLSAERLIGNCNSLWQDPRFDFDKYGEVVGKAYQQFGSRAGSYFNLSYPAVFNLGIAPEDYFDLVNAAVESGGKVYAGWYAYGLPDVLKEKIDPSEFRSSAYVVYKRGGLKVAVPFILNAPKMLKKGDIKLQDLTQLSVEITESLGKKTAQWVIKNMADLDMAGYSRDKFRSDVQELNDTEGEKAAFWYAFGFTDLLKHKREALERLGSLQQDTVNDEDYDKWIARQADDFNKKNMKFNPLNFGREYVAILKAFGANAATFYSFSTRGWDFLPRDLPEQLNNFMLIPSRITELHAKVNKKVFNSAMWFILKMERNPKNVVKHLEDTIIKFEEAGEKETIVSLAYTAGIGRRKGHPFGLVYPVKRMETYLDASGCPADECWGSLLKQTDIDIGSS